MATKEEKAILRAKEAIKKREEVLLRKKVRLKNLEVRAAAKEKKLETRRDVIAGKYLRVKLTPAELAAELDSFLTSPRDRELFGLTPLVSQGGEGSCRSR